MHLDFERDIVEIQAQIDKLLDLADRRGIDVSDEVQVLRDKLDDDPDNPRYIQTERRLGYRFIAPA